jgi:hypothetical protein
MQKSKVLLGCMIYQALSYLKLDEVVHMKVTRALTKYLVMIVPEVNGDNVTIGR